MSLNKKKILSENDRSESNYSDLSDLSISTDNKVFGGAINLLNNNNSNIQSKNDHKKDKNTNSEKDQQNSGAFSPHKFCNDAKININEILDNSNALEPLSFRPRTSQIEKNCLESFSHQEYSTNYTMQNTLTSNSGNRIESIKNELNNEIKFKYINQKQNYTENTKIKESVEEKEIYREIEEEELANFEADQDVDDKNVFWNLKNNVNLDENIQNRTLKKCKSNLEYKIDEFKPESKSFNKSQINCVFSKVDKGNAILVSSNDIIFSLPLNFLPKNATPGNSYKISIEETEKIQKKINYLQLIQKKLLN